MISKKSLKELNDIRNEILQIVGKVQTILKKYYDKRRKIINFNQGYKVSVKFLFQQTGKSPKLAQKYRESFEIAKKISDLNYKIKLTLNIIPTEDIIHVRWIKPYYHR